MNEPRWITEARQFIGLQETPGDGNTPEIVQMFKDIKRGGIRSDEIPWCSAFVGSMLERCGITSSRFESAKSYVKWGVPLLSPRYGCVVVFSRNGGGHVGFAVGRDSSGRLLILGGNQNDEVSIKAFSLDRVIAYRWPVGEPLRTIPLDLATASESECEA